MAGNEWVGACFVYEVMRYFTGVWVGLSMAFTRTESHREFTRFVARAIVYIRSFAII